MAVDRFPEEIAYYNDADDLLQEDDIIETDIRIAGWNKKFRIRALSFGQMSNINKNATILNKETDRTELNDDLFAYWTIVEGVVRPKFTFSKAERLVEKNGTFIKELVDEIWSLGRVNKRLWDDYMKSINDANELAAQEKEKK